MSDRIMIVPSPDTWRPSLRRGMKGDDVAGWQRVLLHSGYSLAPYGDDGDFGGLTLKRTIQFQLARGLEPDGIVEAETHANIGTAPRAPSPVEPWPFMQSAGWTWSGRKEIRLVVVHTMETGEGRDTAEAVAAWFAGKHGKPPKASAHVCVDGDSLVRCVKPEHVAWAAPGANRDGYQVEHAGRARQTAEQWDDDYSRAMLDISAAHVATVVQRFGWTVDDVRQLSVDEVRGGTAKGVCGHYDVTRAFRKSDHVDPGPHFPWARYLDLIREGM